MRALSIRQPYAELILRGIKTIEYRSRPTRIVGERFYLYASKGKAITVGSDAPIRTGVWSRDLDAAPPPAWMVELAQQIRMIEPDALLPVGVIVGSAVIERVTAGEAGLFRWHLVDVERIGRTRKPTGHPQPVWFRPFAA